MRTTKLTLVMFTLLASLSMSQSQNLSAGLIAGYSTGSVRITDIPEGFVNSIEGESIKGIQTGLFAKVKAGPVYFRPMALLHFRNGKVTYTSENPLPQLKNFTIAKAEIPVLFGANVLGPLFIEAGPMYNYVIASTQSISGHDLKISRNGIGYRIGAGVEIGRVLLSVSYQGVKNNSDKEGLSSLNTPDELIFGLGLRLSK